MHRTTRSAWAILRVIPATTASSATEGRLERFHVYIKNQHQHATQTPTPTPTTLHISNPASLTGLAKTQLANHATSLLPHSFLQPVLTILVAGLSTKRLTGPRRWRHGRQSGESEEDPRRGRPYEVGSDGDEWGETPSSHAQTRLTLRTLDVGEWGTEAVGRSSESSGEWYPTCGDAKGNVGNWRTSFASRSSSSSLLRIRETYCTIDLPI